MIRNDVHISDSERLSSLVAAMRDVASRLRDLALHSKEVEIKAQLQSIALEIETGLEF